MFNKKDPYLERETQKYEHPVPSREFIIQYLEKIGRPVSFKHLLKAFNIHKAEEKEGIRRRLKAMERDGQLLANRRKSYALVKQMDLIKGRVQAHRDGFGFLIPEDGSEDIFLSAKEMRQVFSDDVVLVRVARTSARRREGSIIEILVHNTSRVLGRFFEEGGVAFIDPVTKGINQDIIIVPDKKYNPKIGQFVMVDIISQPTSKRQAVGRVTEILGDRYTPGMEVQLAIRAYDLPFQWSKKLEQEVQKFKKTVQATDKKDREDLRHLPFVTIDGDDAKDFDDAVYCEPVAKGGWKLFVAIADVSHYVKPNTILDAEAKVRGNSVYFPNKVIPMLPELLSNELCSLKPKQDRLVVVCEMRLDSEGNISRFEFYDAVIHSQARLTYTEVYQMLQGKKTLHEFIFPKIKNLYAAYKKLQMQRIERGAIEFESIETRIKFDDKGKIKQIVPVVRNDAHRIIEEAMLAANVCASNYLKKIKIPTLFRIHEGPNEEKLNALRDFLKAFGLRLTGGKSPTPTDYARLLERVKKRPDATLIQTVMLRSLKQAVYSPEDVGHFGLAYQSYCHFTSPIRRYPDLIVHRALKHSFAKKQKSVFIYDADVMLELGEHCSNTERRADKATRDATDWLKCEFMLDKIGQTYEGRIVEVTGFGIFVELQQVYVQGLVHITSLQNDYYHHDVTHHLLRGSRTGKEYRLGDPIRVLVARVDLDERKIDFDLGG